MLDYEMEPPSHEDLLINEKIMRKCNHASCEILVGLSRGFEIYIYTCTGCGELFLHRTPFMAEEGHPPQDYFQRYIHHYSADKTSAKIVRHKLETMGWKLSYLDRDGQYVCVARKDGTTLYSDPRPEKHRAMFDSAAKIARIL